ncbi:unnamed protein product [Moneuplotes crassus]|uniref:Uncharacterized protein n=1 Tax=Euplotes crassus TaxID=5936 RepID=A0AAD1UN88_EUPCR|nr:unnamed protein product [Moneuplotes crassus]
MNNFKNSEENITDDLLNENVTRKAMICSLHRETMVMSTPFGKRSMFKPFRKVVSCPIPDLKREARVDNFESFIENKNPFLKKKSNKTQYCTKNIQEDIRNLLKKAIQIRNLHNFECDLNESPKFGSHGCGADINPKNKEVTVGDLHNPSCL